MSTTKKKSLAEQQREALLQAQQDMQQEKQQGANHAGQAGGSAPTRPATTPMGLGRMPGTAPGLTAHLQAELERLRKLTTDSSILDIPLDRLIEVPGRRRTLSKEAYEQLSLSLKDPKNLIHPITVTPAPDQPGYYRIVSGHNRSSIFREHGHESIKAYISDIADEDVDRLAFFANLMQTELPDYEKYVGLARELEVTGMQQQELAASIGMSKGYLTKVLAYGDMPAAFHDLLRLNPYALPIKQAYPLVVRMRKESKNKWGALLPHLQALCEQETSLAEFLQEADEIIVGKKAAQAALKPILIGKAKVHNRSAGKRLVLEFGSAEERLRYERTIMQRVQDLEESDIALGEDAESQDTEA